MDVLVLGQDIPRNRERMRRRIYDIMMNLAALSQQIPLSLNISISSPLDPTPTHLTHNVDIYKSTYNAKTVAVTRLRTHIAHETSPSSRTRRSVRELVLILFDNVIIPSRYSVYCWSV